MRRLHDLAFVVVVLIAAALCAWLSVHIQFRSDWSYGQRASLSSRTQDVLKKLNGPVSIVSYARTTGELRGTIAAFIARYQQLKPDIALRFVDPDTDPDAMRKQAITLDGEMVIHYAERTQRVN
jgi:hypothetical protein